MDNFHPVDALHAVWIRHRWWLFPAIIALMAVAAVLKLEYQFRVLLWEPKGAIDLRPLHSLVHNWFVGRRVKAWIVYPPASFVLLWPLLGWFSLAAVRWVWAISFVGILAAIVFISIRISG